MIKFSKVRAKNFLSVGNYWMEFDLDKDHMTCLRGLNGQGKCVSGGSRVKLKNKITGEILETSIEEFYEVQKEQNHTRKDTGMPG